MRRGFPRADHKRGINKVLLAGFIGALVALGIDVWGLVKFVSALLFGIHFFAPRGYAALFAYVLRTAIDGAAAWRFAIRRGLVWGSFTLLLVLSPLAIQIWRGYNFANIDWTVARLLAATALIIGIRGAWRMRSFKPQPDYTEVFE